MKPKPVRIAAIRLALILISPVLYAFIHRRYGDHGSLLFFITLAGGYLISATANREMGIGGGLLTLGAIAVYTEQLILYRGHEAYVSALVVGITLLILALWANRRSAPSME